jgi:peroxiredoxin
VGDAAPDFNLMGAGFETTSLSSLKGQKVVLAFFPAAFSGDADGGCQCQLASLQSIDKEDGISVLGITRDTPFVMGPWSEAAGIKCLCDTSLKTQEAYVGTIDFGKFLDDLDVSTNMAGYMSSKRGCVVLDENQKVTYAWTGMPDQLPDVTEIQAALGIGKVNFE